MKAIRFHTTGGPEVLRLEDIELPPPGAGEARVRHTAIGVNFIDTYHRSGLYAGVAAFRPRPGGRRRGRGGGRERNGAESGRARRLLHRAPSGPMPKPTTCQPIGGEAAASVSDEIAAASLLKGMTAQYLLKRTYAVKAGQTILFHAAAGGVGLIACQWAKHLGVTVIGSVGSDDKGRARARQRLRPCGEHAAQPIGRSRCARSPTARACRWSTIPSARTLCRLARLPWRSRDDGLLRQCQRRGARVRAGASERQGFAVPDAADAGPLHARRPKLKETADDVFAVIASGAVKVQVNQRFKLGDARKAHEALHSRTTTGATVLIRAEFTPGRFSRRARSR